MIHVRSSFQIQFTKQTLVIQNKTTPFIKLHHCLLCQLHMEYRVQRHLKLRTSIWHDLKIHIKLQSKKRKYYLSNGNDKVHDSRSNNTYINNLQIHLSHNNLSIQIHLSHNNLSIQCIMNYMLTNGNLMLRCSSDVASAIRLLVQS